MRLDGRNLGSSCSACGGNVIRPVNNCDPRKVISITKAGEHVIIALDDCTFLRAPLEVLDSSVTGAQAPDNKELAVLKNALAELQEKVNKLSTTGGAYDDTEISNRVKTLETAVENSVVKKTDLVEVHNFNGDAVFKAMPI